MQAMDILLLILSHHQQHRMIRAVALNLQLNLLADGGLQLRVLLNRR